MGGHKILQNRGRVAPLRRVPGFESRGEDWLSFDEARHRVLTDLPPLPAEIVPLEQALGRALTHDVVAPTRLPPWDNSEIGRAHV